MEKRISDYTEVGVVGDHVWMEIIYPGFRQRLELNINEVKELYLIFGTMIEELEYFLEKGKYKNENTD